MAKSKSETVREEPRRHGGAPGSTPAPILPIDRPLSSSPFLWPLVATAAASEAAASYFAGFAHALVAEAAPRSAHEPRWATPHRMALELQTLRLRDFSLRPDGVPVLVCAPFALHGATVADFASGHSLVQALLAAGASRLFVTDWRSASPEMRLLTIDNYLADLNIAVDEVGAPVDLVGLCQGGWLSLIYAARFPDKVRRLVIAGAPIDVHAGASILSRTAADVPLAIFEEMVRLGDGRILGHRVLDLWGPALDADEADRVLQVPPDLDAPRWRELHKRFREWYAWTIDLPGTFYLQVVEWLFKENQIAAGRFVALGRTIDLADVRVPLFLLAARDDELVSPDQLLATAKRVGTPKHAIETAIEPCGHLSLFLGAETLRHTWPKIARWLARDLVKSEAA